MSSNFLPQERVHSFAQLTSQQLLTETMSTVGGKVMLDQFERLQAQRHQETSRQQVSDGLLAQRDEKVP